MHTTAKRLLSGLIGLIFCLLAAAPVPAAEPGAAWAAAEGQQALVYLQGADPDADFACQIGSTPVVPAQTQEIASLDTPIHTVILVDNSVSIPSSQRPLIREILEAAAGNRLAGETFSIATIAETTTWLCEAQTDYLQIKAVLDAIGYYDQQTRLTDCLYETVARLRQQFPGQFCRIFLVADGVDNQQIGYTREELDALISQAGYPIYAIGCTNDGAGGNEALQQLFALSRLTGGQSFYLGETQDVNAIAAGLAAWNSGVRLVFDLPVSLCDGSTRQMQVTSGGTAYTVSLTMPFAAAPAPSAVPTPVPTPAPAATAVPAPAQAASGLPAWAVIAILAAAAVAVLIVIGIAAAMRRRGVRAAEGYTAGPGPRASQAEIPTEFPDWPGAPDRLTATPWEAGPTTALELRLSDVNDPRRRFQFPLQEGFPLILGRDSDRCNVVLDYEPSVSRVQCEIRLQSGEVWLHNLSQSNITQINGQRMEGECRLNSGSTLKLGRLMIKVEYPQ